MLTNDCFYPKINNLRVILNCFYIYLISHALQSTKQVFVHYPESRAHSIPYTRIYIIIRSAASTSCILFNSSLIIYALWCKRVGILFISILLLLILLLIRLALDIYGYSAGYFEYSLYSPFGIISPNVTNIDRYTSKQMKEEMTDFIGEFVVNMTGILATVFILIRMIRKKWRKRQLELEILTLDVTRRKTV